MRYLRLQWLLMIALLLLVNIAEAQGRRGGGKNRQPRRNGDQTTPTFLTTVPAHPFDLILGRPTHDSVTLSIMTGQEMEGYVAWGKQASSLGGKTPLRNFKPGEPVTLKLDALAPDTQYAYRFHWHAPGSTDFSASSEYRFHTQRPPGAPFTFTVTADSHLDERATPELYQRTLENALADAPDFHIDLGDTFMSEKHPSRESAVRQYLAQRYYFGQLGHSAPLFLVLGNHDGEGGRWHDGTPDSLAAWSNQMRVKYFPNPEPDGFYSGNAQPLTVVGQLQDYYAWTWGDALFIVLDPFWYAQPPRGRDDNWSRTLGDEQYRWLERTLTQSRAKFKFIFIHHLVGGLDKDARGGAEAAPFFEWGGKNLDGSDGFEQHRPGWPMPIHQLLARNRVSAVFHGHDHIFVKQDLDGIVYQEVPQPGFRGRFNPSRSTDYGYTHGTILGPSGHLRIRILDHQAMVEYVSARLAQDEVNEQKNRRVEFEYVIPIKN